MTWGTNPQMVATIDGKVPDPQDEKDPVKREWIERALKYMDLEAQYADHGDQARQDLHRRVHQFAHRGPARGRRRS